MPRVSRLKPAADDIAAEDYQSIGTRKCALLRSFGFKSVDTEMFREMLNLENGAIVKTLREVADAFDMAAQTVKGDWRDNRMPGRPGHWDLAAILTWRFIQDGRAKGYVVEQLYDVLYRDVEKLAMVYGAPLVLEGATRYHNDFLATCEQAEREAAARGETLSPA